MIRKACFCLVLSSVFVLGSSTFWKAGAAGAPEILTAADFRSAAGFTFLDGSETVGSLIAEASEADSLFSCAFGTCSNDFDCRRFQLLCPPGVSAVCILPGGASCSGNCSCGPVDQ